MQEAAAALPDHDELQPSNRAKPTHLGATAVGTCWRWLLCECCGGVASAKTLLIQHTIAQHLQYSEQQNQTAQVGDGHQRHVGLELLAALHKVAVAAQLLVPLSTELPQTNSCSHLYMQLLTEGIDN
jgi:hypothetical protein